MKLHLKHAQFSSCIKRLHLATKLSCFLEGESLVGIPYMPNAGDDSFWTLDHHNDWKLQFGDEPDTFWITYRYGGDSDQGLLAYVAWVCQRTGATIVT